MHDRARIHVQAGAGGDGCLSFRREAHVPKGGPDGGDGGRGGDVVLVCDDSLRDLRAFRRQSHYKAGRGGHGQGSLRHGADGRDARAAVPPGHRGAASRPTAPATTSSGPASARSSRAAAPAGAATSGSPARPTRRRGSPSAGCRRRDVADAAAQAARRRRAGRPAQRRQVVAAVAADPGAAEGRRLPVHDARAGARHARRPTIASW